MYRRLGGFIADHWILVILCWILLVAGLKAVAPRWDDVTQDGDLAYLPEEMTSVRGGVMMAAAFPDDKAKSQLAFVIERPSGALTDADKAVADEIVARLNPTSDDWDADLAREWLGSIAAGRLAEQFDPASDEYRQQLVDAMRIDDIWSYQTEHVGSKLVSPLSDDNGQATLVVVRLKNEFMAIDNIPAVKAALDLIDQLKNEPDFPAGLNIGISGSAAIGGDMLASAQESVDRTEITTIFLVLLILIIVYRSPALVVVPLLVIVTSVAVATSVVAMLADFAAHHEWLHFQIFKTSKIFITVILYGSGTDYCLFIISRYREELEHGFSKAVAIARAVTHTGDAVVASALTSMIGLSMMFFADFGKFRNSGPAIALCLFVALLACMTLAPAILRMLGKTVYWPFGIKQRDPDAEDEALPNTTFADRFWNAISRMILARPGVVLVVSVLLLSPPVYSVLAPIIRHEDEGVRISFDLVNDLQDDRPGVQGTKLLRRHFSPGETGPITVVAKLPGTDFISKEGIDRLNWLTTQLRDVEGVSFVRSMAQPYGDDPRALSFNQRRRVSQAQRHAFTKERFVTQVPELNGSVTRLDVVLDTDPFSGASIATLDRIDDRLMKIAADPEHGWKGTEFDYIGTTAGIRDLTAVNKSDRWLIQQLVVLAVFGVLLVVIRRPIICVFLMTSVVFGYLVTIGMAQWLFTWLYGDSFVGLDWKVPIYLFVILTAVGADYNIYLVTRILEEQKLHGPRKGLQVAIVRTGGIISSCGLIMAGSFVAMMTGTLRAMIELGFALSFGIILDTFVIRPMLVPAFFAIIQRLNREDPRPAEALSDTNVVGQIASDASAPAAPHPAIDKYDAADQDATDHEPIDHDTDEREADQGETEDKRTEPSPVGSNNGGASKSDIHSSEGTTRPGAKMGSDRVQRTG
ncbi:MAG: MMPL family transporter [Planctomycetales bacterium]|nr:MMPL family transporter [Planctomycetales bacterium]